MVKLSVVRIVEEEWEPHTRFLWNDNEIAAFDKIEVTSTSVDENLQRADIWFRFRSDQNPEEREAIADICTHEGVWSCEIDLEAFDDEDDDKGIPGVWEFFGVEEEELGAALLNFGERVMGMYS